MVMMKLESSSLLLPPHPSLSRWRSSLRPFGKIGIEHGIDETKKKNDAPI